MPETTRPPRTEVPAEITAAMRLWREGLTEFPQSYIDFHRQLAERHVEEHLRLAYIVHKTLVETDGWMDGMRALTLIVENRDTGRLARLQWHDSNQEFFVRLPGHRGSVSLRSAKDMGEA